MATGSDGSVIIDTKLDTSGFSTGAAGLKQAFGGMVASAKKLSVLLAASVAGIAAATVALTKASVGAYADFQQLSGGIETLFKGSAYKMMAYAESAFFSVGQSANDYMRTVTSFSASLISSVGGDTEKAADIANMAMVAISDNANKLGTDFSAVQTAFLGFSKQQYMLLDNLKLGYGGTKTEMERLLKDAEAITGVKYDIDNLADVYTAINEIQKKLGITGTTAAEAEKTISGAANMMKAAWQNVLSAISGGMDLDKAINNLVYSLSVYIQNIVPVIESALIGIGNLIEKILPMLVQNVASALIRSIPSLVKALYNAVIGAAKGIKEGIRALFTGGSASAEISASINDVASGYGSAAENADEYAEATENAGKAAKRALMGFDEINKLTEESGGGVSVDIPSLEDALKSASTTLETTEESSLFSDIDILGPIKKAIEEGDWYGLGQILANKISEMISDIDWSSVGSTIGTLIGNLISFVLGFLLNIDPGALMGAVNGFLGGLFQSIAESLQNLNWQEIGAKLLKWIWLGFVMANPITAIIEILTSPNGDQLASGAAELVGTIIGAIGGAVVGAGKRLWEVAKDLIDGLKDGIDFELSDIWEWVKTNIFQPFIDGIRNAFKINSPSKVMETEGGYIIEGLKNGLLNGKSKLRDTCDTLWNTIKNKFSNVGSWFKEKFSNAWNAVLEVFSGDSKTFEGIKESMSTTFKEVVNRLIDGINKVLNTPFSKLNSMLNKIRSYEIFGQTPFMDLWGYNPISVPKIPYLAKGAVIPPNAPFMAVLGDQRHGTNIEAPLSTIQEAVANVMEDYVSANMSGHSATVAVLQDILEAVLGIEIGDDVISNAAQRYQNKMAIVRGG